MLNKHRFMCLLNVFVFLISSAAYAGGTAAPNALLYPGMEETASGDVQLVLLGTVIDEATLLPLENMTIQLIDNFDQEVNTSQSTANGNFYFPLEPDKLYTVNLLQANGALLSTKKLSTINRFQPEILRVLLSVGSSSR